MAATTMLLTSHCVAADRCSRYLAALGILNNGSRADAGAALGASLRSAPSYNTGLTSIFEKFFPLRGIFQKLRQPCCRYRQPYLDDTADNKQTVKRKIKCRPFAK